MGGGEPEGLVEGLQQEQLLVEEVVEDDHQGGGRQGEAMQVCDLLVGNSLKG